MNVRNCREIRQSNRAVYHFDIPDQESMRFRGEFREWEHLLRIGD